MNNDAGVAKCSDVLTPGTVFEPSESGERTVEVAGPNTIKRLLYFLALVAAMVVAFNAFINSGLRELNSSQFGVSNLVMQGKVNAQIVITGSSRAVSHYDSRIIQQTTGLTAFNLGKNGSQTDMQVAFFKAYLEHNRAPEIVIHNLDGFSFVTTREVYDPAQYIPYLSDPEIYKPLQRINSNIWKSRYLPLYGYAVEDMRFTWLQGVAAHFGWRPKEDFFQGFNPRTKGWTTEFQNFRNENPHGVSWDIEPAGQESLEELMQICKEKGIRLILVYSPEYSEMQTATNNRKVIFGHFQQLADKYQVPLWDYSDWKYSSNTEYFTNSQHLNAKGAEIFSQDLSNRLKEFPPVQMIAAANSHPAN